MRPALLRAYDPAGEVIVQMALPADRPARFDVADRPLAYVVFYDEAEVVLGRRDFESYPQGVCWVDWEDDA